MTKSEIVVEAEKIIYALESGNDRTMLVHAETLALQLGAKRSVYTLEPAKIPFYLLALLVRIL